MNFSNISSLCDQRLNLTHDLNNDFIHYLVDDFAVLQNAVLVYKEESFEILWVRAGVPRLRQTVPLSYLSSLIAKNSHVLEASITIELPELSSKNCMIKNLIR